jgi:hypothetical protein
MRLLLVDTSEYYPSSPMFHEALQELSTHTDIEFDFVDEATTISRFENTAAHKVFYRASRRRPLHYRKFNQQLIARTGTFRPDVILIVKGANVAPATLRALRSGRHPYLVNFATDDPFNPATNTPAILGGLDLYDLICSPRRAAIPDIENASKCRVRYVRFGYKPQVHFPEPPNPSEAGRYESDVAFIGGADADRVPFFEHLTKSLPDARLALYGGGWDKHPDLRRHHRGFVLGREFRNAIGGATVSVNLVRRANRDGHVMRTFEVPACGGFMLAERTEEHREIFGDDKHVGYFDDAREMVEKVAGYLAEPHETQVMAADCHQLVVTGGHTYKDRLLEIIDLVGGTWK